MSGTNISDENKVPVFDLDEEDDVENDAIVVEDSQADVVFVGSLDLSETLNYKTKVQSKYHHLLQEQPVLLKFIETCIKIENTQGLLRIINRTLLPMYRDTTDAFKNNRHSKFLLNKQINKIKKTPHLKFSIIKELCDVLKLYSNLKKRANLITLDSKLNGQFSSDTTQSSNGVPFRQQKLHDVIEINDDEESDIVITNSNHVETGQSCNQNVICKLEPNLQENLSLPKHERNKQVKTQHLCQAKNQGKCNIENIKKDMKKCRKLLRKIEKAPTEYIEDAMFLKCKLKLLREDIKREKLVCCKPQLINQSDKQTSDNNSVFLITPDDNDNTQNHDNNGNENVPSTIPPSAINNNVDSSEEGSETSETQLGECIEMQFQCPSETLAKHDVEFMRTKLTNLEQKLERNLNNNKDIKHLESSDEDLIVITQDELNTSNLDNRTHKKKGKKRNSTVDIDLCDSDEDCATNAVTSTNTILPSNPRRTKTSLEGITVDEQVKILEKDLERYSLMVRRLEENEVTDDGHCSQYVLCDNYKLKIVNIYKRLCKLKGTPVVKSHKMRLHVAEGHEEGPVRCLEEFINSNLDGQGYPAFPDILDVVNCVCKANNMYGLSWSRKQIFDEAQALFKHCGVAIQKRRKRREWRDLVESVEDDDPADRDPALQARLEQNAKIFKKQEMELLERYAKMETKKRRVTNDSNKDSDYASASPTCSNTTDYQTWEVPITTPNADYNTSNTDTPIVGHRILPNLDENSPSAINTANIPNQNNRIAINTYEKASNGNITDNVVLYNVCKSNAFSSHACSTNSIDHEIISDGSESVDGDRLSECELITQDDVHTFENIKFKLESKPFTNENRCFQSQNSEMDYEEPSCNEKNMDAEENIEPDSSNLDSSLTMNTDNIILRRAYKSESLIDTSIQDTDDIENNLSVKTGDAAISVKAEKKDIHEILNEFTGNVTATVIEIEDPFLVIEISDSSDSEDE